MTSLLLRVDAGPAIGVGHLSRCVALAEEARARGWEVALCGAIEGAEWLVGDLPVLPAGELAGDIVVIDHYGLGSLRVAGTLVSVEDGAFGRRPADVVVDANLASSPRPDDGTPVVLRGPRYAPLRAEVRAARAAREARPGGSPLNVVVVMGGGASGAAVGAALLALRDTKVPVRVRAISAAPVDVPDAAPGQDFVVTGPTTGLPALFAGADLVVSAAGVTLLELCCIGVPAALVQLADNQAAGYTAAVDSGLAARLGTVRDLLLDPARRDTLAAVAKSTVDGLGARRILDAVDPAVAVRSAFFDDAELLLAWRNDAETRAWSRTSDPVDPVAHVDWLRGVLANPHRRLLIAELAGAPIGTVRFDREVAGVWEVSITVAPQARGRGLAARILAEAERVLMATVRVDTIRASVHLENTTSRALFVRAGYSDQAQHDGDFGWLAKRYHSRG